jgi:hypothetical protein
MGFSPISELISLIFKLISFLFLAIWSFQVNLWSNCRYRYFTVSAWGMIVWLTLWRRNFLLNFSTPVFKMWIIKEHSDLKVPYVRDVIHERIGKHHTRLEAHPNPLLVPLLQPARNRRLNRCWSFDLQDTWGGLTGCTPHHVSVSRPHISLKIDCSTSDC